MCMDLSTAQWESWRLKRWGHRSAAGTALAELRQSFRYEPWRCCHQGSSYEAASVWWTSNSYCVGWPPSPQPLHSAKSSTILAQTAFMLSDCLVSMVTAQTAYWKELKFRQKWPIWIDILEVQDRNRIYRSSIIMEMWTLRREWKLWEMDQLGIYSVTLMRSLYCRSVWRGMSVTHLKLNKIFHLKYDC